VKNLVWERLEKLGFETIRLPLGAGPRDNHVPIYASPGIRDKKRAILLFPERHDSPLVFSYRVCGDSTVKEGSVLELVDGIMHGPTATSDTSAPGIIIANPSQLYWYRGGSQALSTGEWLTLPRESAVHEPYRIDPFRNTIPHNRNSKEHVEYIFEHVLDSILNKDAIIDIIGLDWVSLEVVEYLSSNCKSNLIPAQVRSNQHPGQQWSSKIGAICFGNPQHNVEDIDDASDGFLEFLSDKCRAYFKSPKAKETTLPGRETFGCNCIASGEQLYDENIIIRCWPSMLDHFNVVHTIPDYKEPIRAVHDNDEISFDDQMAAMENETANEVAVVEERSSA
jgi:hypothetical protein